MKTKSIHKNQVTISWAVNGNYGKIDEFTQSASIVQDCQYQ
jgi:hypothetical protein